MLTAHELRVYTSVVDVYAQRVATTTIGQNIRTLREEAGYSHQGQFAELLGVPQPRLSDWENDRYEQMELNNLLLVATKLHVSIDRILKGTDDDYDAILNINSQRSADAETQNKTVVNSLLQSENDRGIHTPSSSSSDGAHVGDPVSAAAAALATIRDSAKQIVGLTDSIDFKRLADYARRQTRAARRHSPRVTRLRRKRSG